MDKVTNEEVSRRAIARELASRMDQSIVIVRACGENG